MSTTAHAGESQTAVPKSRRATWARRALAVVLIVLGVLLLADGATTLLWQEPFTALYAHWRQGQLAHQLTQLERAPEVRADRRALSSIRDQRRRLVLAARAFGRRVDSGEPVGRIQIGSIGLSAVFVQGTAEGDLSEGPGHYPATRFPGDHGTVAIAGHRTTFGAWFRHVDELRPGDQIRVAMPYGRFTYRVQGTRIVPSSALWITRNVGYERLVLSACHPLFSASKRIIVFARLVSERA